jgi:hypothetical protein
VRATRRSGREEAGGARNKQRNTVTQVNTVTQQGKGRNIQRKDIYSRQKKEDRVEEEEGSWRKMPGEKE